MEKARQSVRCPESGEESGVAAEWQTVRAAIARNVKMGPFHATSGIDLPYYLNATTNFLDKKCASTICVLLERYLDHYIRPLVADQAEILVLGMECAGGIMVSQLACRDSSPLSEWCSFLYLRKEKKTSGTLQQLEGEQRFTDRHPDSPVMQAVWLDDVLSTGTSMRDGVALLKQEYNIEVVAALYLVDRSPDRANLPEAKLSLADPSLAGLSLFAIFDLEDIEAAFPASSSSS